MKHLKVLLYGRPIGTITFDGTAYVFEYDKDATPPHPLSLSLPLGPAFTNIRDDFGGQFATLPHYFENLLPEGWLLDVARSMRRVERADKLDLLYELCRDTLGAVSLRRDGEFAKQADFAKDVAREGVAGRSSYDLLHCGLCGKRLVRRGDNGGFHARCSISFFGTETPPEIDVDRQNLRRIAEEHLARGESVTGSQEKFSMKYRYRDKAMVVPGFSYIVKPMQPNHPEIKDLPRVEHVIMRFADAVGLGVAPTGFIKLRDGTDAFITRRFDRATDGSLIHAEDLAQATGDTRGVGHTYNGSHEAIARTLMHRLADKIRSRSSRLRFLRATIFNYIFGNTDAHLKNHSIIWERDHEGCFAFSLAALYDIVPCLLYTDDGDELGLPLGGKTKGFARKNFDDLAELLNLRTREIDLFIAEIRDKRSLLIELARAYAIDQGRVETLFELAASRIAVIVGSPVSGDLGSSVQTARTVPLPVSLGSMVGATPEFCQSEACLNPKGKTVLRGARRRARGICSYCDPEGT